MDKVKLWLLTKIAFLILELGMACGLPSLLMIYLIHKISDYLFVVF